MQHYARLPRKHEICAWNSACRPHTPPNLPPTLEEIRYTQAEIGELVCLQAEQEARINSVKMQPSQLSPSGRNSKSSRPDAATLELHCPFGDCIHHGYEVLPEFYGHLEVIHNMSRFGLKIVDGRLTFEVQKIIFSCCRTIWTNHNFK
jgi:hypothetical protein